LVKAKNEAKKTKPKQGKGASKKKEAKIKWQTKKRQ